MLEALAVVAMLLRDADSDFCRARIVSQMGGVERKIESKAIPCRDRIVFRFEVDSSPASGKSNTEQSGSAAVDRDKIVGIVTVKLPFSSTLSIWNDAGGDAVCSMKQGDW